MCKTRTLASIIVLVFIFLFASVFADTVNHDKKPAAKTAAKSQFPPAHQNLNGQNNVVESRLLQEAAQNRNPFLISFYQPTYVLPFYYTTSPDQSVYAGTTPDQQSIKPYEVKFQLSFKAPVWQNIMGKPITLYAAYSQVSYWQAYNQSAFFRETNYEPELFLADHVDWPLFWGWRANLLQVGMAHQSNGKGGDLERSWNRPYAELTAAKENWVVSLMPWYILHDSAWQRSNPDISHYMGYGRVLVGYKLDQLVFTLMARNMIESSFHRGALEFTCSFPLTTHFSAYVQFFSGYGQSLIEYNHYTNGVGVGFSLSNWI